MYSKKAERADECGRWFHVSITALVLLALLIPTAHAQVGEPALTKVQISFRSPAYIGMPLWLMVKTPNPHKIHYPASTAPSDFGCNTVEVRHNGHLLVPEVHPNPGGVNGAACGWVSAPNSPESRLPLHIQYSITEPGTYMVRYTRHGFSIQNGHIVKPLLEESDWTPLEIHSAPPGTVQKWLSSLLANLPTSPGTLVGDALPSLLASRNRDVFRAMLQATYNGDEVVSLYASNTIPMFDAASVQSETLDTVRRNGPNDALAYAFSSYGNFLSPIADRVAYISADYLHSAQPIQVAATVHMLYVLRQPYYHLSTATLQKVERYLREAVDTVIAQRNEKAASWLSQYLAISKSATAHEQLWKLADAHLATEQTLICVGWLHNPADLPKIASIVETYDPTDPYGNQHSGVVGDLRYGYGDAVRPYLRDILQKSQQVWVRVAAAKELTLMGDSTGYQFFIETLQQRPFYHDEMVRWLQVAFPAIRTADEASMLQFLESRKPSN